MLRAGGLSAVHVHVEGEALQPLKSTCCSLCVRLVVPSRGAPANSRQSPIKHVDILCISLIDTIAQYSCLLRKMDFPQLRSCCLKSRENPWQTKIAWLVTQLKQKLHCYMLRQKEM